jgi:hypothetical protein
MKRQRSGKLSVRSLKLSIDNQGRYFESVVSTPIPNAKKTALLCMDYQSAIVAAYAEDGADELLSRAAGVLAKARVGG